jgi:ankyrin repeat protein
MAHEGTWTLFKGVYTFPSRDTRDFFDACVNADATTVAALLARGVHVDAENDAGETALMWAAAEGHAAVARLLLRAGADASKRDPHGRTAAWHANNGGHDACEALLVAAEQ